jgi:stage III sporulation protein AF
MIDVISSWAGELVVSLVIVTLIEMLLPDNKIKKYVKTVIGVYIIFCIISPFIDKEEFSVIFENAEKNLEKIQIESQVSSALEDSNSSIEALYIQEFEKDVIKKVEELGYEVKKCEVRIQINATKDNAGINAIYLKIGNKKIKNEQNVQIENVQKVEISINAQEEGNNKSEEENEDIKKVKEFLSTHYEISSEQVKVTQN